MARLDEDQFGGGGFGAASNSGAASGSSGASSSAGSSGGSGASSASVSAVQRLLAGGKPAELPPDRLLALLSQAVAFQVEFSRYRGADSLPVAPQEGTTAGGGRAAVVVTSLARDYECAATPNALREVLEGHWQGVKCLDFVGNDGQMLVSGGSDRRLLLWSTDPVDGFADGTSASPENDNDDDDRNYDHADDDPSRRSPVSSRGRQGAGEFGSAGGVGVRRPLLELGTHRARVWDVATNGTGSHLASVAADGCLQLWSVPDLAEAVVWCREADTSATDRAAVREGLHEKSGLDAGGGGEEGGGGNWPQNTRRTPPKPFNGRFGDNEDVDGGSVEAAIPLRRVQSASTGGMQRAKSSPAWISGGLAHGLASEVRERPNVHGVTTTSSAARTCGVLGAGTSRVSRSGSNQSGHSLGSQGPRTEATAAAAAKFPVLGFRRPLEVARLEVAAEASRNGGPRGRRSVAFGGGSGSTNSQKFRAHGSSNINSGDKASGGSGGGGGGNGGDSGLERNSSSSSGGGGASAEGGNPNSSDAKGGGKPGGGGLFGSGTGTSGGISGSGTSSNNHSGSGSSSSSHHNSSSGFGAASGSGWYSEDLFCVAWHPDGSHLICGGHDRRVQLIDLAASSSHSNFGGSTFSNSVGSSGANYSSSSSSHHRSSGLKIVKTLAGHEAAVVQVATNPAGNLLASASRDGTVRFWDVLSGQCVKRLGEQPSSGARVGEATSMALSADGTLVLTSTRHGAVRLWDLRHADKPLVRYKGHQNSANSFVRCGFGARESVVLSGSDDGTLHVWEAASGRPLSTLEGHPGGASYRALWSAKQGLLASCGEDGTVRTWSYR